LAQQNAALAAALGDRLAGTAALAEAAGVDGSTQQQQQHQQQGQQQQQQQQAISPAKLPELGAMLQRLTQGNAALIKAR
jgi:hypothetical protein